MAGRSDQMIQPQRRTIPDGHPIRALFQTLTERGFERTKLHDPETIHYIADLLTNFIDIKNLRRMRNDSGDRTNVFAMMRQAGDARTTEERRACYQHVGDVTLFYLGLFPESLTYGRQTVSPDFYAEQGRRSYQIVAAMDASQQTIVFRKLSNEFERCVVGLNWVKHYINDPFYQYVFREFGVT
jgi:hypothetical protein